MLDPEAVVRAAVPGDAPGIGEVVVLSWRAGYAGQLPAGLLDRLSVEERTAMWATVLGRGDPAVHVFVAERHGAVVGFVCAGPSPDRDAAAAGEGPDGPVGAVFALYVHPAHWGRGIGRRVLAAAEAALRADGYRRATLWVLVSNERGRRFYERCGWVCEGSTQTEFRGDTRLDEVRYARRIAPPS